VGVGKGGEWGDGKKGGVAVGDSIMTELYIFIREIENGLGDGEKKREKEKHFNRNQVKTEENK
jgi:hypothetical protein